MRKKIVLAVISFFVLFGFLNVSSFAQDLKIGYVGISKVFDEYKKTKDENKKLEDISSEKQQEREKMVSQIQKIREEMKMMSDKGQNKQRQVLEEKVLELQNFDRKARSELKMKRDEIMKEILDQIQSTVQKYAKDKKYDLIFYRNALLYHNENLDVTQDIINVLNSQYKK
jgi:Skp family chaperone for outer membrane proteins